MSPLAEKAADRVKPARSSVTARAADLWQKLKAPEAGDHGAQRWRKIFISTGGAISSRALAFGFNLLMIPIALRYLGPERYGIWMTLTSSVSLLTFFDFGICIGFQNRVAEMLGKGLVDQLAQCMRSTLIVLLLISAAIFTSLAIVILRTDLSSLLFRGEYYSAINLKSILVIITGAFVLGLPLGIFPRMAFGLQQGWVASVSMSCGTVLSLVAVFSASLLHVNFTAFVAITVIPPIATQVICYFILAHRLPGELTLFGPVSYREGLKTLRAGSHYILPQIMGAILTQGPMVILGTFSSPINAAIFSILTRISTPFQQVQQMLLAQIWPAITEAMHRGDGGWLNKTLRRVARANFFFGIIAVGLVIAATKILFPLLAHDSALMPTLLVMGLYAAHVGASCIVQGLCYIANGLGRMRRQNYLAIISLIFAFTILPLAANNFGTEGTLLAMIGLNCFVTIPLLYLEYSIYQKDNAPA